MFIKSDSPYTMLLTPRMMNGTAAAVNGLNNGKFFAGLALGALVGSALSCFAHSNRGRKLRRDVYDAIQDLQEDAKDLAHHAKHKAEQVSSEVAGKVGEKVEEVKGKIHEAANK